MRERCRAGVRRAAQGQKSSSGDQGLAPPSLHSSPYLQEYSLGWQLMRARQKSPEQNGSPKPHLQTHSSSSCSQTWESSEDDGDRVSWRFWDFPTPLPAVLMPSPRLELSLWVHGLRGRSDTQPMDKDTDPQSCHRVNGRPASEAHLTPHIHSKSQGCWLRHRTRRSVSGGRG